ncbi:FRG domain-containing protein [Aliarcobacter butzleri]|uniref:FRG domain-containing protein n=1 Tax=Aliarcobacter butzleri TaxID=28197 RepID=UPI0011637D11|nr:FRG domain-containing protein [Aliarcobacter butzleri]QDM01786.1 FRG domain-containing protein [Aliarcobacter butzleri]
MAYQTKNIDSLTRLIEELEVDLEGYGGSVWYRGQTNDSYTLLPSYLRDDFAPEKTLLSAFKQNATMLTNQHPVSSFDWLFVMQHYGIPTRLLDWTESPLIALYFALKKHADQNDAVIWALKPTELNKNSGIDEDKEDFLYHLSIMKL